MADLDVNNHSAVFKAIMGQSQKGRNELLARYHRAHLLPNLDAYAPKPSPVRPKEILDDDWLIADRLNKSTAENPASPDFLAVVGKWRSDVMKYEVRAASDLSVLLLALRRFECTDDWDGAMQIRRYLANNYGLQLGDGELSSDAAARAVAERASIRYDLMSEALRSGRKPERNSPARAEPDDDPERLAARVVL